MQSFLEEVADLSLKAHPDPGDLIFVLPSKRAGSFLKNILARKVGRTVFSPRIYSIEDFVEHISGLEYASNPQLLFELYQAYLDCIPEDPDSFYDFCKWGQTLLQDFNEIDRFLIPVGKFFSYLADVKKLEQWTATSEKTPMIEGYLRFWNSLEPIYHRFNQRLLESRQGYQGLVYRKACDALPAYLGSTTGNRHVFLGFNALNKAESLLIQTILQTGRADIYWDTDPYFLQDPLHDAGYFIRQHRDSWKFLVGTPLKGLSEFYTQPKNIQIAAIPKSVAQMKYAGMLLSELQNKQGMLGNTAMVLGDESLLNPLLHAIPEAVGTVNITMGYPLKNTPLEAMFSQFFELYLHRGGRGWFYKNVLSLLSHPYVEPLFDDGHTKHVQVLVNTIKEKNWIHLTSQRLASVPEVPGTALELLFFDQPADPPTFIKQCLTLILALKPGFQEPPQRLVLEQLYRFFNLFNQLKSYLSRYDFVTDLKTLYSLYQALLSGETVDFRGEPMEGLQVMGMLESRNLDFETVILTSVNEGILPSGKGANSFIPFDLKREFGLPTYKEKDAVYTYHFYRLLQRARNVYLLYNTEPDVLEGGEKSRLISQLLTDPSKKGQITQLVATPEIVPHAREAASVPKDPDVMQKLRALANRGFSPSSLTNYIRNPIDFYKKSLLGIDEALEVDETITASVFGTVIHGALEDLYRPYLGQYLSAEILESLRPQLNATVQTHLKKAYAVSDIGRGKNLIAYKVLVRYMERLLDRELEDLGENQIQLLALEHPMKVPLQVPGLEFPVTIRGIIDRIDLYNDRIRIIDYKSGNVISGHVEISDWSELASNYDKSKAFQLLTYAMMYRAEAPSQSLEAGIISLKNINSGLLRFGTKERGSRDKDHRIDEEVLQKYNEILQHLLLEIFNEEQPFTEKFV